MPQNKLSQEICKQEQAYVLKIKKKDSVKEKEKDVHISVSFLAHIWV